MYMYRMKSSNIQKKKERNRRYNKVTESENCAFVPNAIFYWEPMEFFQKWYDMITLRLLVLLYASDLFGVGYTCENSIETVFSVNLLDRIDAIDAILLSEKNVV